MFLLIGRNDVLLSIPLLLARIVLLLPLIILRPLYRLLCAVYPYLLHLGKEKKKLLNTLYLPFRKRYLFA